MCQPAVLVAAIMAEQHADFWQTMPKWSVIVRHWFMGTSPESLSLPSTTQSVWATVVCSAASVQIPMSEPANQHLLATNT